MRRRIDEGASCVLPDGGRRCLFLVLISFILAGGVGGDTGSPQAAAPPTVTSTAPAAGATNVSVKVLVEVRFSEAMNRNSVESALSFSPATSVTIGWQAPDWLHAAPIAELQELTAYSVAIGKSASNLAGEQMAADYGWTYTTGRKPTDFDPPVIVASRPASGTVGVATNMRIEVTWSEPVQQATAEAAFSINPAATGSFAWSANTMIFAASAYLQPNTAYAVTIKSGTKDLVGNMQPNPYSFSFTTGTAADTTPPVVIGVTPLDSSIDVPPGTEIVIRFSEPFEPSSLGLDPGNAKYVGFDVNPAPITGKGVGKFDILDGGKIASYTPKALGIGAPGLGENTKFTVTVFAGLPDLAGNLMASEYKWVFTTGFVSPLLVSPVSPLDGEIDVRLNASVIIQFNKPMAKASTEAAVTMKPATQSTFTWTGSDSRLEITFPTGLQAGTDFSVRVGSGARSAAGQLLDSEAFWTFRTVGGDQIPPRVLDVQPADGATGVSADTLIVIRFSEPLDPSTLRADPSTKRFIGFDLSPPPVAGPGSGSVAFSEGGAIASYDPTPPGGGMPGLRGGTVYTLTVKAGVADVEGNMIGSDLTFGFTTFLRPPPVVESHLPAHGESDVALGRAITVKFSQRMDQGSVRLALSVDPEVEAEIDWTSGGTLMTVNASGGLAPQTVYTVVIREGAMDADGTPMAGEVKWSFSTGGAPPGTALQVPLFGIPYGLALVAVAASSAFACAGFVLLRRRRRSGTSKAEAARQGDQHAGR